ncbi:MAG: acetate--CoA ligase family protein [Dehalococcoidales bacterium]|nr:acetate--CoA ligase family protein [Dehalococcoidales bacterium]
MSDILQAFFAPESVAVVGASRNERGLGHTVLKNILDYGFPGRVYPVNPKADSILGLKCYPDLLSIPDKVDLVLVVVPQPVVAGVMREAVEKGIKGAVIISAGFREVGPEGLEAEREITRIAHEGGMRILGPNILGIIDTESRLNATFAAAQPEGGNIAFISQSGALLTAILDWAVRERVGFSKIVSLGNKADISEIDMFDALRDDATSKVVVAYLEGVTNGVEFRRSASELTRQKPLIVVKSGGTAAGSRAVSSHTGSLAGSEAAYDAAFKQSGILRAASMQELFDVSLAFANQPLPQGRRLAIVTNAGGPGILATDACERKGLHLASFTAETIAELRNHLPRAASVYNPIDVIGDAPADRYEVAIEAALADNNVDALLVLLTPQAMTEIGETARAAVAAARKHFKPVLASFMGGNAVEEGIAILKDGGIPNYTFPESAVGALVAMNQYRDWMNTPPAEGVTLPVDSDAAATTIRRVRESGRTTLGDIEAREVTSAYGLTGPQSRLATTPSEAVEFAREIGYPVVMKIVSPQILHKSDIGGVRVGLQSDHEVETAFTTITTNAQRFMPEARIWGVSVQEMVKPGREVILGVTHDPQFGHLIMFGLGGIYVEVLKDVSFRLAPLTPSEAERMIREIRSFALLAGVRGQQPADLAAIVDALLRISQLVTDFPEIIELDVNPLVVNPVGAGAVALDARIVLSGEKQ